MNVGFNQQYITGKEATYISDVLKYGKLSGDGYHTNCCHEFFERQYGFKKVLLTSSCTDALEMAALLLDIKEGDEVIVPSYTFVSSANPFLLRGARIVFADSQEGHPNMDAETLEPLITSRTRAIVVVHYGGVACQMEEIMQLANRYNLFVVEDAAHAIDAFYSNRPLGSIGHLGCFSFHESKNISSGEGGLLVINDQRFIERSEIIWQKGTNRRAFNRGEVPEYGWKDIGSSFLPSELTAAFLLAQLEHLKEIQKRRKQIWNDYYFELRDLEGIAVPEIPDFAGHNAHIFYLLCRDQGERDHLMHHLKNRGIQSATHYISLHSSEYFSGKHDGRELKNAAKFTNQLLRLPLYYDLSSDKQDHIIQELRYFFAKKISPRFLKAV